jgi:hypothetical protein
LAIPVDDASSTMSASRERLSVAGFQVIIGGRSWTITEARKLSAIDHVDVSIPRSRGRSLPLLAVSPRSAAQHDAHVQKIIHVFAGLVAGIALVVACSKSGPQSMPDGGIDAGSPAHADAKTVPSDCAVWQVGVFSVDTLTMSNDGFRELPAAWEPVGVARPRQDEFNQADRVLARRCKP